MIMVSVCLPSDALSQHLPSYLLGFLLLWIGVSLHSCSSKAQPLLLTLDEGYLLTTALPDLHCGIAPLGPPAPAQHGSLDVGLVLPAAAPGLQCWGVGYLLQAAILLSHKNEILPFVTTRLDLEAIMLSEINQTKINNV